MKMVELSCPNIFLQKFLITMTQNLLRLSFLFIFSSTVFLFDSLGQSDSVKVLQFQKSGIAKLGTGLAEFSIPAGFKFLDPAQSAYVLQDLWGNPPSPTYGMIFPEYANDTFPTTWAIEISYSDEGHVDDGDASEIDYNDLLEQLKESAKEEGEARKSEGYPAYELLGWASPPFYDATNKKLHWAKLLKFDGDTTQTLNYNIRVLGRTGVLVLNAIGSPADLNEINQSLDGILKGVNFTKGNTYADYQEGIDKKASYGIAGLIAGGILAKTGILAKLGIFFAKFAKLIFIGIAAAAGGLWKWITGKKSAKKEEEPKLPAREENPEPPEQNSEQGPSVS
jgi:uncharacterized membrane-anchored protein